MPPGLLVLVVGPSGAGKDAVIAGAKAALGASIIVARRTVTRPPSDAEDNLEMAPQAFAEARAAGAFCLSWDAHGHAYGVPASVVDALDAGRTVIANVSRGVVDDARRRFRCLVVEVTAPAEVLERRRAARGRASDGWSGDRGDRRAPGITPDLRIVNDGALDDAVAILVAALREAAPAG